MTQTKPQSKGAQWTGWIISVLCILFLLLDAGMKIAKAAPSMDGSTKLGWPADLVQCIGFILLVATVLYAIPRTAVLGAILITAYLGGAVAIMMRADQPCYFPIIFGVLVWAGIYLRDMKLRAVITG